jgi:hypothetical protein
MDCCEKQLFSVCFFHGGPPMSFSLKDEVRDAALGDQRLTKRLGKVIEQLGAKPNMSVPAATRGRAEMEAAYRFFDNDKVSPEKILQPHIEATRERISQAPVVLLVQYTTDSDADVYELFCESRATSCVRIDPPWLRRLLVHQSFQLLDPLRGFGGPIDASVGHFE